MTPRRQAPAAAQRDERPWPPLVASCTRSSPPMTTTSPASLWGRRTGGQKVSISAATREAQ
eukprot:4818218-Prymnesium_polylepis.1